MLPGRPQTKGCFPSQPPRGIQFPDNVCGERNLSWGLVTAYLNDGGFVVDLHEVGEDFIEGVRIEDGDRFQPCPQVERPEAQAKAVDAYTSLTTSFIE